MNKRNKRLEELICPTIPPYIEIIEKKGRFREEINYIVNFVGGDHRSQLFILKVFHGRPPYYKRWAEMFSVTREIRINGFSVPFKDSKYEEWILDCLSYYIGPGENVFIETLYDEETERLVEIGVPIPLTRLGYKLLERGFTWFKAWYYPEGFMEGSTKIQASKPLSKEHEIRNVNAICMEIRDYYEKSLRPRIEFRSGRGEESSVFILKKRYEEIMLKFCELVSHRDHLI